MPNWKKLITSGSSGSLAHLSVDTSVEATSFTGSILSTNGILSSSAQIATDITGSFTSTSSSIAAAIADLRVASSSHETSINTLESKTLLSSSAQIATDISGSITSTSSSIASDIATLVSFSSSLETTIYDYTGSFTGDGSGLTGVQTTIVEEATVLQTFTSATTASVSHLFGTKNVIVTVYDENDDVFIPSRINTPDVNTAVVYMDPATTGRVVVAKGGHLVSGSLYKELITGTTSSVITHNLQEEFPIVQLYESASKEVFIPQTIKSIDLNNTEITLSELLDCYVVIKR